MKENPMRNIRIAKVTVNIGIGEPGDKLKKAHQLLETMTGRKAVFTKTMKRSTFGTPKGREIGTKITLRGEIAKAFLKRALASKENKVKSTSVSDGNFALGIKEHIEIPGTKYDSKIGIFGMDVCVTLERPGYRISRKKLSKPIGQPHRITREETSQFIKTNLGAVVE
ncbi:MAG: 50S ribosomal protein L5 [Candidatus Aenigmarchaeota archaeon]|nr:50S ribosomal protein L5 [Candidatus Aenigmarchaeota archaeon]